MDEDIKRVDKGGILDSEGNYAPDGVVGPYREREASFYTVKQLWPPIIVTSSGGTSHSYTVTNRYGFLNADQCTYEWQRIAFRRLKDAGSGSVVLASRIDHGRSLAPGASANWDGWGPPVAGSIRSGRIADATRLSIKDSTGPVVQTYVWPVDGLESRLDPMEQPIGGAGPTATESGDTLTAKAGDLSLQFSKTTGLLVFASRQGSSFSLANGPRVVAMAPRLAPARRQTSQTPPPSPVPPATAPDSKSTSLTHQAEGNDLVISAAFDGPMKSLTYRLKPNGWLSIDTFTRSVAPMNALASDSIIRKLM